jgi:ubiquinol-cytochrome c reductase cytochrome b subunit
MSDETPQAARAERGRSDAVEHDASAEHGERRSAAGERARSRAERGRREAERGRRGPVERYVDSLADRLGAHSLTGKVLRKVFPNHFSFLWGEVALYSFIVLLVTGTYLTLFFEGSQQQTVYEGSYEPLRGTEVSAAFDSVMRISFDVKGGLLIRQTHHWAALVFVGAIALHMARVFFTGAFRKPRELNWVVGVLLLILALAAGFTGYSLPDDLLSGTGLRITHAIILAIPFIGERTTYALFGGEWPGTDIIGRLYPVHILLIPAAIVGLLTVHLALVWRQKHTQFTGPGRTERNVVGLRVWPGFAIKSVGLLFLVAGVITAMGALFHVNAVWLYGPYDTGAATSYSQPDWYIGFLEGSLRLFPPWETRIGRFMINNVVYSGVLIPGVIFTGLLLVPWIECRFTKDFREHHLLDRPRDAPQRTAAGVAATTFVAVLFLGGAQDVIATTLDTSVGHVTTVLQLSTLLAPPIAYYVTLRLCRALVSRPGPERTERSGGVVRDAGGGYHEADEDEAEHGAHIEPEATDEAGAAGRGVVVGE